VLCAVSVSITIQKTNMKRIRNPFSAPFPLSFPFSRSEGFFCFLDIVDSRCIVSLFASLIPLALILYVTSSYHTLHLGIIREWAGALLLLHKNKNTEKRSNIKMAYGSGRPAWDEEGGLSRRTPHNSNGSINNNNNSGSYQQGGGRSYQSNYQAPQLSGTYAEQQSQIMEDAMRTHVAAETTANNVLAKLHAQRHQLQNANDDTWQMRQNVATAQRELKELQQKAWAKKRRLYGIIGLLSAVDLMLFLRIVQCGGSFFCRHYG